MRCRFICLVLLSCLIQSCARDQQRMYLWSHHPNLLVSTPATVGFIGGTLTGGVIRLGMCFPILLSVPFGYQQKVEAVASSNNMMFAGPVGGTYLVGGPFYLLFGWWGPGNISAEKLKMMADRKERHLQWLHFYRIYGNDLKGVDLSGLDLSGCDFHGVDLSGANLSHAKLFRSNLGGAILKNTNLANADLRRAYLVGADFSDSDLTGTDLSGSGDPSLPSTRLDRVKFEGANLTNTNLNNVKGLSPDELHHAKNWQKARLN